MGLPYTTHHAGEIFFGPKDGYLYFMMGDGGNSGDPWNFSQNKKSVLGKALRLDVNKRPGMLCDKL
jgi:glucose/arabinose dehydrogenase